MKKLTPELIKKRRAIARDAIAQLKAETFIATIGTYVTQYASDGITSPHAYGDLQKLIKAKVTKAKPCQVCALGTAFLSAVRLFNSVRIQGGDADAALRQTLHKFFSLQELGVIEASFEQSSGHLYRTPKQYDDYHNRQKTAPIMVEWDKLETGYRRFLARLNATQRLVFLMNAVADNAGQEITLSLLSTYALLSMADTELEGTDYARRIFGW
ncbi:MAG: hypothetical protein ABJA67_11810 [Chthonomonadales bacterium]